MRDDEIYSGHIGYGIRPTERGKGFAKGGLKLLLLEAERIGMGRVLITCDDDNIGSWKVIEANGGAFERYIYNNEGTKRRRYCIQLNYV